MAHTANAKDLGPSVARDVQALASGFVDATPQAILSEAAVRFERLRLSFSGAEDVALVDMAVRLGLSPSVFFLDTGRLHDETLAFIDRVREHYGVPIEAVRPDPEAVADLVAAKGAFSFYEDGHQECCGIRKIAPLRGALAGEDAWITGQRRDQSPTRSTLATFEVDPVFSPEDGTLVKVNPLAFWRSEDVWAYLRAHDVPTNPLHDRGYRSIGCEPCTRATKPGEHERAGRWWWEEATQKECGLHAGNGAAGEDGPVTLIATSHS